jgi:hypothetical protein
MTSFIQVKLASDAPSHDLSELLTEPNLVPGVGDIIEMPIPDGTPIVEPVTFVVYERQFKTRWLDDGKLQVVGVLLFLVEPESVAEGCLFRRRW